MNDTKWKAALSAIEAIPGYRPRFRTRLVTDQQEPTDHWDGSFPWHVPPPVLIEWLELDPIVRTPRGQLLADACEDFTEVLSEALVQARVPFSIEGRVLRIWGYLRPGAPPNLVGSAA